MNTELYWFIQHRYSFFFLFLIIILKSLIRDKDYKLAIARILTQFALLAFYLDVTMPTCTIPHQTNDDQMQRTYHIAMQQCLKAIINRSEGFDIYGRDKDTDKDFKGIDKLHTYKYTQRKCSPSSDSQLRLWEEVKKYMNIYHTHTSERTFQNES